MCGLAGFVIPGLSASDADEKLRRMGDAIAHRGPDDGGTWYDQNSGVGFSHRRLSIVDLSPLGHQPMSSSSGRFVIVFNGEVYNFKKLRQELSSLGHTFKGHSDTEIMLASFEQWGITHALKRFIGMFAFAVWDKNTESLTLARDRIGVKPLYYGWHQGKFFFGSELLALRALPEYRPDVDRSSLASLLRHNYIPTPYSIYSNTFKLTAGSYLELRRAHMQAPPDSFLPSPSPHGHAPQAYWSLREIAQASSKNEARVSDRDVVTQFEELLLDAIGLRMVADVPVGAFLSGGIDSSTVVALMQHQSSTPVRTFSIGFEEKDFDEAGYAREVARHLRTLHTELYVTAQDARDIIPQLPTMFSEPFADSSMIPTYLVSKLARQQVSVSLSGDGGDELLSGYSRYVWGAKILSVHHALPSGLRAAFAKGLQLASPRVWEKLIRAARPILPDSLSFTNPGEKLHKFARVLSLESEKELYYRILSHWDAPTEALHNAQERVPFSTIDDSGLDHLGFLRLMAFYDILDYLPDDIMVKVDRCSMAVSLEAREPLLDHRLFEFVWRLPDKMRVRGGKTKWLLRQILYRYVPADLVERPKRGFAVPLDVWLRGPLRAWAEELLSEARLEREGYFDARQIQEKWQEHLSGKRNWQHALWNVLMFQAWLAQQTA